MVVAKATAPPTFEPTNASIALPERSQAQNHQLLKKAAFLLQGPLIIQSLMQQHWPHLDLQMTFLLDQVSLWGHGNLHRVPWTYQNMGPPLWDRGWIYQVDKLNSTFISMHCNVMNHCIETMFVIASWQAKATFKCDHQDINEMQFLNVFSSFNWEWRFIVCAKRGNGQTKERDGRIENQTCWHRRRGEPIFQVVFVQKLWRPGAIWIQIGHWNGNICIKKLTAWCYLHSHRQLKCFHREK